MTRSHNEKKKGGIKDNKILTKQASDIQSNKGVSRTEVMVQSPRYWTTFTEDDQEYFRDIRVVSETAEFENQGRLNLQELIQAL